MHPDEPDTSAGRAADRLRAIDYLALAAFCLVVLRLD